MEISKMQHMETVAHQQCSNCYYMMKIKTILIKFLEETLENLKSDNSNLTEEDAINLLSQIANININKQEAASRLGISEKTFDRKINAGEIPQGIKPYKETKLRWKLSDILNI